MTTPVNFKTAKLLKDKGFEQNPMKHINQATMEGTLVFPTIAEVVMWLYEKHGVWVRVDCNSKEFWAPVLLNVEDGTYKVHPSYVSQKFIEANNRFFNTPTEAYEAAIEYVLTNLI